MYYFYLGIIYLINNKQFCLTLWDAFLMRSRVKYFGFRDYNKVHIIKNNIYFTVALDKHTHGSFPSHIFFLRSSLLSV